MKHWTVLFGGTKRDTEDFTIFCGAGKCNCSYITNSAWELKKETRAFFGPHNHAGVLNCIMTSVTGQERESWYGFRNIIHLGVICSNKNSEYHVPTYTWNSIFLMWNQRFREMKQSAKVIQIISKLLRARAGAVIILPREPQMWVHSLLMGCLHLTFNIRGFFV